MKKIIRNIAISIILGMALLRFGYTFKNDWLSIITQSLGYIIISYPFYLFFKFLIYKIKSDIERARENKKFYSQTGGIWGFIKVGDDPLNIVKCTVKNEDGSLHKWSHRWINLSDRMGYYEINYIPKGKYKCYFSRTWSNGSSFVIERDVEVFEDRKTNLNIEIEKTIHENG